MKKKGEFLAADMTDYYGDESVGNHRDEDLAQRNSAVLCAAGSLRRGCQISGHDNRPPKESSGKFTRSTPISKPETESLAPLYPTNANGAKALPRRVATHLRSVFAGCMPSGGPVPLRGKARASAPLRPCCAGSRRKRTHRPAGRCPGRRPPVPWPRRWSPG